MISQSLSDRAFTVQKTAKNALALVSIAAAIGYIYLYVYPTRIHLINLSDLAFTNGTLGSEAVIFASGIILRSGESLTVRIIGHAKKGVRLTGDLGDRRVLFPIPGYITPFLATYFQVIIRNSSIEYCLGEKICREVLISH